LCHSGGVEAHDEVVARVVLGLVLCGGFWEEERTPVRDPTDHATGGEDLLAGCAGDSERESVGYGKGAWEKWIGVVEVALFDLGQIARPDLG
jgi:hypothetical protein